MSSVRFSGTASIAPERPSLAGVPGLMTIGLGADSGRPRAGGFRVVRDAVGHPTGIDKPVDPLPRGRREGADLREMMESRRMAESLVPTAVAGETSATAAMTAGIGGPSHAAGGEGVGVGAAIPEHVRLTGQMLHFKAYFQESVVESPSEAFRTRVIIIRYFLEDDTVEAFEERRPNDGMTGVKFLRRMQHPAVSIESLRIGETLTLYGKALRVFACDAFTRAYYDERGTPQPEDVGAPEDAFGATVRAASTRGDFFGKKINAVSRYVEAVRGGKVKKKDTLGKFLAYGDEALRFKVQWDSTREDGSGDKQYFMLTFFLSSDEVEIKRLRGYGEYPGMSTLLTRRKLPKTLLPHDDRERSAEDGTGDEDYYHAEDFRVGESVYVFGRSMLIFDCDDYTRRWYRDNFGIDQAEGRIDVSEPEKPKPKLPTPPSTGFGSEEDSLQSHRFLDPRKKPVPTRRKHEEFEGKTLQFMATLATDDPIDEGRKFRITFYLYDDTLAVYEPTQPNSGFPGGKFQVRAYLKNPVTGKPFAKEDFNIGETVYIKRHPFYIYSADSFSTSLMESNSHLWPMASFEMVLRTLREKLAEKSSSLRKLFRKFDEDKSGAISTREFEQLCEYFGMKLSRPEALTIYRALDRDGTGLLDYEEFMRAFSTMDEEGGVSGGRGPSVESLTAERKRIEKEGGGEEYAAHAAEVEKRESEDKYTMELLARLARKLKNSRSNSMVHELFRTVDTSGDHSIDRGELETLFKILGFGDRDCSLLAGRFFKEDEAEIDYRRFMGIIHASADAIVRS